jgi:hypothetical protein
LEGAVVDEYPIIVHDVLVQTRVEFERHQHVDAIAFEERG